MLSFLYGPTLTYTHTAGKTIALTRWTLYPTKLSINTQREILSQKNKNLGNLLPVDLATNVERSSLSEGKQYGSETWIYIE